MRVREPYKVFVDSTFVHHLLLHRELLSASRGPPLFTSKCVVAELRRLSKSHADAFDTAQLLATAERRKVESDSETSSFWRRDGGPMISSAIVASPAELNPVTMKGNKGRRSRSRNLQKAAGSGSGDKLSKLPDDLLLNILERVGTLNAVKTCILSKRMLKLPAMLPQIFIDVMSVMPFYYGPYNFRDLIRINGVVADLTERLLSTRSPEITIHRLKLRFYLRRYDCLSIGKSVARAMATQKLGTAAFTIWTDKDTDDCTNTDLLHYAKQFNTFLGDCPDAFAGLTQLHLQNLRFGESDLPNILTTCKRLESLCLCGCDAGFDSVLQVEHARLVEFKIIFGKFKTVQFNYLPQLQRVTLREWMTFEENPLFLGFVPQLSKLNLIKICVIHKILELSKLLGNVSAVSDLCLNFGSEKIWVLPERPELLVPVLGKLRRVNLENLPEGCDISWTMFILEAAPSLEELSITVWDHWCETTMPGALTKRMNVKWESSASNFKHKNLAKLTIHGFQSDDNFIGYVRRVMEAARNIKEISLHDRKACEHCVPGLGHASTYPRNLEEDSLRQKITEPLGVTSPAKIHFRS